MTSSTTRLSNVSVTKINPRLTGRILIYDRLEFVIIRPWEVAIVDVLLELRIGPGVGNQDELVCGWRSTHVTSTVPKLNRVPSSSQVPGVVKSTSGDNEWVVFLPVTNGMSATLPCNTSCWSGTLRNVPSARGVQMRFRDYGKWFTTELNGSRKP